MMLLSPAWILFLNLFLGLVSGRTLLGRSDDLPITFTEDEMRAYRREHTYPENLHLLEPGQVSRRGCKNRVTEEITSSWTTSGAWHQMSNMLCGPGSVTSSFARTFTRGFAVQLGVFHPTSYLGAVVEKLVPTAQYSQASGSVTTTGYTGNCAAGAACIQWFQPFLGKANVRSYTVSVGSNGALCSPANPGSGATGQYTSPMTNVGCAGNDCKAAGTWGVCYMFNFGGHQICPGKKAASLPGVACPGDFNPSPTAPHAVEAVA